MFTTFISPPQKVEWERAGDKINKKTQYAILVYLVVQGHIAYCNVTGFSPDAVDFCVNMNEDTE